MKLLRYGLPGQEKPGLLDAAGKIRDLGGVVGDIAGEALTPAGLSKLAALDASPAEPVVFNKWTSAMVGPNDAIEIPRGSQKTDWEVELGVVIGKHGRYIAEADALSHVAGYCVINDVSEREYQLERGGTWDKGKGCDTFGPTGPWLVTKDEVPDPHALGMWLEVDGKRYQNGNSGNMIFRIPFLISYLSTMMSLHPGDIISTGTPAGVGLGQKPPVYLRPGNVVRLGIDKLGEQRQVVRGYDG
jgi:2,4-diketo-3-deoxy-L-fuconate hydrolase